MSMSWSFDQNTGTLTISGSEPMPFFNELAPLSEDSGISKAALHSVLPWADHVEEITRIEAPLLIEVTPLAFGWLSNLETAVLPSARIIGNGAFICCDQLKCVVIPSALAIGNAAFSGCAALKTTEIDGTRFVLRKARYISTHAFYCCKELTTVSLVRDTEEDKQAGSDLEFMGTGAFYGCTSLKKVYCGGQACAAVFGPKPIIFCPKLDMTGLPPQLHEAMAVELN